MKKLAVGLVLVFTGCYGSGVIKADAVSGTLTRVVERHQAYVAKDEALTELQRRVALRDGELLLKVVQEAQSPSTSSE